MFGQSAYSPKIGSRAYLDYSRTVIMDQGSLPLPGSLNLCQQTLGLGIEAIDSLLALATGEPCKAEVGDSVR